MGPETQENKTGKTPTKATATPVDRTYRDRPVITVDYDRYAHFLEHADLSEDQKREYLQTIWNVIVEFVSLGFGVHPLQQAQNPCGKPKEIGADSAASIADDVKYRNNILTSEFIDAADLETDRSEEGVDG